MRASNLEDLIYLTEAQWRSLVDLLPEVNRQTGLFDTGFGYPIVIYKKTDEDALTVSSESSFAGEFKIAEDGSVTWPEGWDD